MHLITKTVPGYGLSESRCFPCSGISGRVVTISPCATQGYYRLHSQVKIRSLKCALKEPSFVCKMSSGGHRRNPDFSRQNRNGFSRNRNRQNDERDSFEKAEESDLLSSKNGSLHSLSNTPKFQSTAVPGPREEEIVELFRKVQAQLRERAAIKEEKKIEALQGQGKESETVDSLLKLLRKHSVEQGKKKNKGGRSGDFILDQPEQNGPVNGKTSTNIFDSNSTMPDETQASNASSPTRPLSNFRRKSPVPQMRFNGDNSVSHWNLDGKRKQNLVDSSPEPEHEPVTEPEPLPSPVGSFSEQDAYVEVSEDEDIEESEDKEEPNKDLGTLKLPELRAIAKSRGIKGFSKMKKGELLELLGENA